MNSNSLSKFKLDPKYQGPHIIMSYLKKQKSRNLFKIFEDKNTRYFTLNTQTFEFFYTEKDQYSSKDIKKIDLTNVKYVLDKGFQKDTKGQIKEWSYQITIQFHNKYTILFCQNENMQKLWLYGFKNIIKISDDQPLFCQLECNNAQPETKNDNSNNNNVNSLLNDSKQSNNYIDISNLNSQNSRRDQNSPSISQNNSQNCINSQQSIQTPQNKNMDEMSVHSNSRKNSFDSQASVNSCDSMQRKKSRSLFGLQNKRKSIFQKEKDQNKKEIYWNNKVIPILKQKLQKARNNLRRQSNIEMNQTIVEKTETQKEENNGQNNNQSNQKINIIDLDCINNTKNFGISIQNKMSYSNSCRVFKYNENNKSSINNFIQNPKYFSSTNKQDNLNNVEDITTNTQQLQSEIKQTQPQIRHKKNSSINFSNFFQSSSKQVKNDSEQYSIEKSEFKKENLQQRQNIIQNCFFQPENNKKNIQNELTDKNKDDFNIELNNNNLQGENNEGIKQIPFQHQFPNNLRNNVFNQNVNESNTPQNCKRKILFSPKPRKDLYNNYFKSPQSRDYDKSLQQSQIKQLQTYNLKTEMDYNIWNADDFILS